MAKKKILIAEDNESLRNVLADTFEEEGFEVKTAGDGVEGLEVAKEWMPDGLLLDILMPNMDGREMLSKLRDMDGGDKVKVFVLTNSEASERVLEFMSMGASDYMTKSDWQLEDIVAKVKERLAENGSDS